MTNKTDAKQMTNVCAILLAAGFGTRLRPMTEKLPKPLIPLVGLEPLFYNLFRIEKLGIANVVVNAHHKADLIKSALELWQKHFFPTLDIRVEIESPEILGTGGSIVNIIRKHGILFSDNGALVINADNISNLNFAALLKNPHLSTVGISFQKLHLEKYGPLWLCDHKYVGVGREQPIANAVAAHKLEVHYLSPQSVEYISRNDPIFKIQYSDLFNGIYKPLRETDHAITGVDLWSATKEPFWYDLGERASYLEAQADIFKRMTHLPLWQEALLRKYPGLLEVRSGVWMDKESCGPLEKIESPFFAAGSVRFNTSHVKVGPTLSIQKDFLSIKKSDTTLTLNGSSQNCIVVTNNHDASLSNDISNEIVLP